MKSNTYFYIAFIIASSFYLGTLFSKMDQKTQLNQHYFDRLKSVKSGLIDGSCVDSKQTLEAFEDQTELYMHLDGYNGVEILEMKCKAMIEAVKKRKLESDK